MEQEEPSHFLVKHVSLGDVLQAVRNGTAAPTANANYIGEWFIDTTNSKAYVAKTTGMGAADWFVVN